MIKCACSVQDGICQGCWDLLLSWTPGEGTRAKAFQRAGEYSKMTRSQRIVFAGERYAQPMPVKEYVYQILIGSEAV